MKKKRVLWLCLLTTTTARATNVGKAYQTILQEGKGNTGFSKGATISRKQSHKYQRQQQMHCEGKSLAVPEPR